MIRFIRRLMPRSLARPPPFTRKFAEMEEPLRSDLFSPEQMRHHGRTLAESHKLISVRRPHGERLLSRLFDNESVLNEVQNLLVEATMAKRRIVPAADWLLDNFYLIEEHIRTSKRDLPKGYSRGLPRLQNGQSQGLPRVYDLALERISHSDGLVDPETLFGFLEEYQSVSSLTLGELWAIPIMLRLALIENLRRVAVRIAAEMQTQIEADSWADRMTHSAETAPKNLILLIADMARADIPMVGSFVAELTRKLQGKGSALILPLTWIEQRLSETGMTIDRLVQATMQQQAADQVSIGNSIRSLRSLEDSNWKDFVESTSVVEKILREDPMACYPVMDFMTRDHYRHIVEELARQVNLPEAEVAHCAIDLAQAASNVPGTIERQTHVGYYLADIGIQQLKLCLNGAASIITRLTNFGSRAVLGIYTGSVIVSSGLLALVLWYGGLAGGIRSWGLVLSALVFLLAASGLAANLVNWLVTLLTVSKPLPRMDYAQGIPEESRTLVVVPAMLSDLAHLDSLIESLEIRWLANRNDNLLFGLLTDFPDASDQVLESDAAILSAAKTKIDGLNEQYCGDSSTPFFLFHRGRRYNGKDRVWMGYERKRGKLGDLNTLLRGGGKENFDLIIGQTDRLPSVVYVITLDTDTQLPRGSAWKLIGTMAHPLNRPRYDPIQRRIIQGYGLLQPRVAASLPGANRSPYARLAGNEPGIDPYTRMVSDVYQDLFNEGSFIGKGIYDVDAFELVLKDRFPENRILSHDLIEGCYLRSGLVSDIQVFEASPSTYLADVGRRHRWIRGDWQLLQWLMPRVPIAAGRNEKNPLSALSYWKILDNLRRSLSAAAVLAMALIGWGWLANPMFWTLAIIGLYFIPAGIATLHNFAHKPADMPWGAHQTAVTKGFGLQIGQAVLALACLPHEVLFSLGAVLKTLWRLIVSGRNLLEWRASDQADKASHSNLTASWRQMWPGPVMSLLVIGLLCLIQPIALLVAMPVLFLWFISPTLTWWLSQPIPRTNMLLSNEDNQFLRLLARKTWAFFETFVTAAENWLPPDNFQEIPSPKIAHRTSPTNIGLALLSNLSAYDLGYISAGRCLERSSQTLQTMARLERYRDHFFNWYDTQTLQALLPRYVSTVDSGNLAAHLLTTGSGLADSANQAIMGKQIWEGLDDSARVLENILGSDTFVAHARFRLDLALAAQTPTTDLVTMRIWLVRLKDSAQNLVKAIGLVYGKQAAWWSSALVNQTQDSLDELDFLLPWLSVFPLDDELIVGLPCHPSIRTLLPYQAQALSQIQQQVANIDHGPGIEELTIRELLVTEGLSHCQRRLEAIESLSADMTRMATMDFGFLFSKKRQLLTIGYQVDARRRDSGFYDLLASEARLASFLAIAQGQIPQENWFVLGRSLADVGGKPILFSWSGSMFEYLMPLLVLPTHENTLLDQTCKAVIASQIAYGKLKGIPWGVSESGYNSFDVGLNYQYHAFGVPDLGLKRGLDDDLVIAPYASALALLVAPEAAAQNLQNLSNEGFEGDYGLYEAIDYTESRVPTGHTNAVVRSYMAHHQGMSLVAIASQLLDRPMQKRFSALPIVQSSALLLEEKIPRPTSFLLHTAEGVETRAGMETSRAVSRVFTTPDTNNPEVHLLSNGRYHVMVSNAGGGYSRWKDLAITRWHEDSTCDNWGTFLYLKDVQTGETWSNAFQPTQQQPESYEAIFSEGRAEYRRHDHDIDSYTEITVSPEDDIELRRLRISNRSRRQRIIEITSYAEVVLATAASDAAHPGFSNLFVQTEILPEYHAILCTRRPRSEGETIPWMFHLMSSHDSRVAAVSYETDRAVFIGRGNSLSNPLAMQEPGNLSGTQGSVLDPIVAIRYRIVLEAESSIAIDIVIGIAETREITLRLTEKYQSKQFANRAFELARTHSQVILRQINGTEAAAQLYGRLSGSILYQHPGMRTEPANILANRRGQSDLWGYSVSGDRPIVLLQIQDVANIELVQQMVQAHAYWRQKGLAVDLVIWNEDHGGYRQAVQEQILGLIGAGAETNLVDRPGGIFLRSSDQISTEDRMLFQAVARVVISDQRGTLEEQVLERAILKRSMPRLVGTRTARKSVVVNVAPRTDLLFFNGIGGYSQDGREYIATTTHDQLTPAPWSNVIANPTFGTVVSESGMAYTWSENAHEFRLSPWFDDPLRDLGGEVIYVRDDETGQFWSPSPLPCRGITPYLTRHGFGYSVFEHSEFGIRTELWIYVAVDAPIKFSKLIIRNESGRPRKISVTGYVELVLGEKRASSAMHVVTEIDRSSGAILARNSYNTDFAGRQVFFDANGEVRTITADRKEFIGRNGSLDNPDALGRTRLSGKVGAALDPCAAIQISLDLVADQESEIIFRLGSGRNPTELADLLRRFRGSLAAREALEAVHRYWNHTLSACRVETPDPALNVLANGWLIYQILSSRLWGRSGYYQSGGAFGFRDQLQDTLALIKLQPGLVREQLLRAAGHQFVEGDVQHWWHPPGNRGSRSRCSDDYLWLPYVTARYVDGTGDHGVLNEMVHFIEGRLLNPLEEANYDLPIRSEQAASLYDHCVRSISHSMARGDHGLPLMGSGDWNDGMNLVGQAGQGESVWLAFFLHDTLERFSSIARGYGDTDFAEICVRQAESLSISVDKNAWDGAWYRRAYFDDGSPLGSTENSECRIDSIAQSWSVLSGAGDPTRATHAMESLDQHLVRRDVGLIQLLDPPFDQSAQNPGYIKGYVPGVRENGGQYTHAAIWAVMAFAKLGDKVRAWELFDMINPVRHAITPEQLAVYKVEPYVMAADVYAAPPHTGRGGWTWYTGSAGWMYQLILESLLGIHISGDCLQMEPCLPKDWPGFVVHYRYHDTGYHIRVHQLVGDSATRYLGLDGYEQTDGLIHLVDDHREHQVELRIPLEL